MLPAPTACCKREMGPRYFIFQKGYLERIPSEIRIPQLSKGGDSPNPISYYLTIILVIEKLTGNDTILRSSLVETDGWFTKRINWKFSDLDTNIPREWNQSKQKQLYAGLDIDVGDNNLVALMCITDRVLEDPESRLSNA